MEHTRPGWCHAILFSWVSSPSSSLGLGFPVPDKQFSTHNRLQGKAPPSLLFARSQVWVIPSAHRLRSRCAVTMASVSGRTHPEVGWRERGTPEFPTCGVMVWARRTSGRISGNMEEAGMELTDGSFATTQILAQKMLFLLCTHGVLSSPST